MRQSLIAMAYTLIMMVVLMTTTFIITQQTELGTDSDTSSEYPSCPAGGPCDLDDKVGRLLRVTSRLKSGKLTDAELDDELFNIMELSERPGSFYSVGYETGVEPGIVLARQDVYRFSAKLKIPLTMPGKKAYVLTDDRYRKPLLIVDLDNDKMEDVPDLPTGITSAYRSGGSEKQLVLFKHPGSSRTCNEILKDRTIREFERWNNAALIIPENLFCTDVLSSKFNLIKARLPKREVDVGGLVKTTRVIRREGSVF